MAWSEVIKAALGSVQRRSSPAFGRNAAESRTLASRKTRSTASSDSRRLVVGNPGGVQTHCTDCAHGVLVVVAVDRCGKKELRFTLGRIDIHRQDHRGPDQYAFLPGFGDHHRSLFDTVPPPQRGGHQHRSPLAHLAGLRLHCPWSSLNTVQWKMGKIAASPCQTVSPLMVT